MLVRLRRQFSISSTQHFMVSVLLPISFLSFLICLRNERSRYARVATVHVVHMPSPYVYIPLVQTRESCTWPNPGNPTHKPCAHGELDKEHTSRFRSQASGYFHPSCFTQKPLWCLPTKPPVRGRLRRSIHVIVNATRHYFFYLSIFFGTP